MYCDPSGFAKQATRNVDCGSKAGENNSKTLNEWLEDDPDLLKECNNWYNNNPEWWGIDPQKTQVFYRKPEEVAKIRKLSGERGGHHPHGLALGGPIGQKLTQTGETRKVKNLMHSRVTGLQRKVINKIKNKKGKIIMNQELNLWLKENGWNVKLNLKKYDWMENKILNKYSHLPKKFVSILEDYQYISSKDDTTWFICGEDYLDNSDDAFKWNEFERMSLEIAEGDEVWSKKIKEWWSDKLPFIMSVNGAYSYYAIDFGNAEGAIIMGQEPEFEEACVVAKNFDDFLEKFFKHEII